LRGTLSYSMIRDLQEDTGRRDRLNLFLNQAWPMAPRRPSPARKRDSVRPFQFHICGVRHLSHPSLKDATVVNRIAADYDVNPGRIAEVKKGYKFQGSREEALRRQAA
jgi:hypothetical protein